MSTVQRIAKNSVWQLFSNISQKVFTLVLIVVLAQKLGVDNFGLYSFAFSFVSVFAVFADFGINILFLREVSKRTSESKKFASNALSLKVILSVVSFLLIVLFGFFYGLEHYLFFLVILAAISMLLDNIAGVFKGSFFAFEVFKYEFFVSFISKSFFLVLGLVILLGGHGLIGLMIVAVLSSIINLLLSIYFSFKHTIKFPFISIKLEVFSLMKYSLPFFAINLLLALSVNLDVILLQFFWAQSEVGAYSAALRLICTVSMVPVLFVNSLQPVIARFYVMKNNSLNTIINKSIYYLSIFAIPFTIVTVIFAQPIVFLFFGNDFSGTVLPLSIMAFSLLFSFSNVVFINVLSLTHKEKNVLILLFIQILTLFVFDVFLIPKYAQVGAAIAFLVSQIVSFLIAFYFVSRNFPKVVSFFVFLKPFISAALMGVLTLFLKPLGIFLAVPISVSVYILVLFLLKSFSKEDVMFFKKSFNINI